MAPKVAILKIFKPHLHPNGKSEPKLGGRHLVDMEIQNCLNHFFYDHDGRHILKIFNRLLTWSCWPCFVPHPYVGHLEGLQLLSAPKPWIGWSGNLVEGIGAAWIFRIAKMVLFCYPRWPPWHHGGGMIDSWELEHLLGAAAMMWELLCLKISALLLYSTWTD